MDPLYILYIEGFSNLLGQSEASVVEMKTKLKGSIMIPVAEDMIVLALMGSMGDLGGLECPGCF